MLEQCHSVGGLPQMIRAVVVSPFQKLVLKRSLVKYVSLAWLDNHEDNRARVVISAMCLSETVGKFEEGVILRNLCLVQQGR